MDVILRFLIRRDLITVFHNRTLPGIVSREGKIYVSAKHIQQQAHIFNASLNVLAGVVDVRHTHAAGRRRH